MSEKSNHKLFVSWPNVVVLVLLAGSVGVSAIAHDWWMTFWMGVLFICMLIAVARAHRCKHRMTDLARVNALEYADERDRQIGMTGLAAVGAFNLVAVFALYVWAALSYRENPSPLLYVALAFFLGNMLVWAIANWIAARRF